MENHDDDDFDDDAMDGDDDDPGESTEEAMEAYQEVVNEIEEHRDRLRQMHADGVLTPDLVMTEVVETIMPLLADFSAAAYDNQFYMFRYLSEQVEPLVTSIDPNAASQLPTESLARVNVLLQMFRGSLQVGMQMAPNSEAKAHAAKMMAEVEQAIVETGAAVGGIVPQLAPVKLQSVPTPPANVASAPAEEEAEAAPPTEAEASDTEAPPPEPREAENAT